MEIVLKIGRVSLFIFSALVGIKDIFSKNKLVKRNFVEQMYYFGVKSFPMVFIVSLFTGMVLVIQTAPEFKKFGAEGFVGGAMSLAIIRELGPTLTAVIIAGRVGSAITAELGSMKVTEQVAALKVMAVNPIRYLVSPRLLSGLLMLPILTIFADVIGTAGGYIIGVVQMDMASGTYMDNIEVLLRSKDIWGSILKSFFFGAVITIVSCYKGMSVEGGAEDVGKATTDSVVQSIVYILIVNFILSYLIYGK